MEDAGGSNSHIRVRKPSPPSDTRAEKRIQRQRPSSKAHGTGPNPSKDKHKHVSLQAQAEAPSVAIAIPNASAVQSSRNSPEPVETDQQGHYVGPSSGASFLLRVQRRLKQQQPSEAQSTETSIFTFGDLPLPEFDPRVLILPPKQEAERLVDRYFNYGAATHRYVHQQTVESWLEELYETNGMMRGKAAATSRIALLFMIFAVAENYPKSAAGKIDPEPRYASVSLPSRHKRFMLRNRIVPDSSRQQSSISPQRRARYA